MSKYLGYYGLYFKCDVCWIFIYRGAGQEVGRSCHMLEFKGKKIMVKASTLMKGCVLLFVLNFPHAFKLHVSADFLRKKKSGIL